jgi:D-alanyl-D-alanine-carboxypeptidase/D-alanyl-D-alanine-endopeptidase
MGRGYTSLRRSAVTVCAICLTMAPTPILADPLLEETVTFTGAVVFLETDVPGLVIGAIRKGETAVVGFGRTSANNAEAPDGRTLIRIGSVTKAFTGATLASMAADGTVGLTDRLQDRLGSAVAVPETAGNPIRLIDLATYSSGLPREAAAPDGGEGRIESEEALLNALQSTTLLFPSGRGVLYSNFAFDLLAVALARAAGKSYAEVVKERVLDLAGLTDTIYQLRDGDAARVFQGHDPNGAPLPDVVSPSTNQGSGSLYSTPDDILRWLAWHLDRFAGDDSEMRTLDHAAYLQRDGLDPVFGMDEAAPMSALGLGWVFLAPEGDRPLIITKSGGFEGTFSYVAFAPTRDVGVFISVNQFNFNAFPIMAEAANNLIAQIAPR